MIGSWGVPSEPVPKRAYLVKAYFEKHGYTPSCPGCKALVEGGPRQGPTHSCKTRLEKEIKHTDKYTTARKRQDYFLEKALIEDDAKRRKKKDAENKDKMDKKNVGEDEVKIHRKSVDVDEDMGELDKKDKSGEGECKTTYVSREQGIERQGSYEREANVLTAEADDGSNGAASSTDIPGKLKRTRDRDQLRDEEQLREQSVAVRSLAKQADKKRSWFGMM